MNPIEQLHDQIMDLSAQLEGKRLELALAQGDMTGAHLYMKSMYTEIRRRRAYRAAIANASIPPQVIVHPTELGRAA